MTEQWLYVRPGQSERFHWAIQFQVHEKEHHESHDHDGHDFWWKTGYQVVARKERVLSTVPRLPASCL